MSIQSRLFIPFRRYRRVWLLLAALLCLLAGPAAASDRLALTATFERQNLDRQADFILDSRGTLTLDNLLTDATLWQPVTHPELSFGFTTTPLWLRLELANAGPAPQHLLLEISYPVLDQIDLYDVRDRTLTQHVQVGDTQPFDQRPLNYRNFLVPFSLAAGESTTLYLRVQTEGSLQVPLTLWEQEHFQRHQLDQVIGQGAYFGIMFIMALYNLFIWASLRDRNYLLYSIFVLVTGLFVATLKGFSFQYLWPDQPFINQKILPLAICTLGYTGTAFAVSLLKIRQDYPRLYKAHLIFYLLYSLALIISLTLPYHISIKASAASVGIASLGGLLTGFYIALSGHRTARLYTLSWGALLAAVLIVSLNKAGILVSGFLSEYAIQLGSVVEVLLLSFALASRITDEIRAREQAQHDTLKKEQQLQEEQRRYLELQYNTRLEELKAQQKVLEAEAESRAKSEFLATMSHEIRTPMNGVLGMAELLQDTGLNPQQQQYVDVIASSGKALLDIINDILDYSKIAAGKMVMEKIDFDLDKLCLECASVFSLTAERKRLELVCSLEPGTPTFVKGDPTRVRQILLNLLGNAFKFTNEGIISLRVQEIRQAATPDEHLLRLEVRDSGIGISATAREQLFQAFSQADTSTSRQFGGTGLGLSISKRLSEMMGGEIGVHSTPGQGSTFWFTIRCGRADDTFVQENYVPVSSLKGRKLLIVDDSPDFAHVVKEQAESWGMRAKVAYFGEQALSLMEEAAATGDPFELATLDMNMPGMSGLDCARQIRSHRRLAGCRCILLTAMRVVPPRDELTAAGIELAMQKPASARALRQALLGLTDSSLTRAARLTDTTAPLPLQGKSVLVAEDNSVNQMVIAGMLKKMGLSYTLAANGEAALQHLQQDSLAYDLVLMDCEMPQMDGYTAARRYREFERQHHRPRLPILALTAHVLQTHQALARQAGMDDHITKPVDFSLLKEKLLQYLLEDTADLKPRR